MRVKSGTPVPEHWRRALRLAIGVSLPCLVGYGVILPEHARHAEDISKACKWAALTACVVNMPVVAKTAQVGLERSLGAILGGALGFATYTFGDWTRPHWSEWEDGVYLSAIASAVAAVSVLVGKRLGLDLSARLFVMTFLLTTFGAAEGQDPMWLAVSRVAGITSGVLIMVVLSCVVLPKSASMECVHSVESVLRSLTKLNALAFESYLPGAADAAGGGGGRKSAPAAPRPGAGRSSRRALLQGGGGTAGTPGADPEAPWERRALLGGRAEAANGAAGGGAREGEAFALECETVLTGVYQQLFKLQENAELGRTEWLLFVCQGRPVFVPGLPDLCGTSGCSGRRRGRPRRQHMPWEALGEVATAARRVARRLLQVITTFEEGVDAALREALGPERYAAVQAALRTLAASSQATFQAMEAAFPGQEGLPAAEPMEGLRAAAAALAQLSDPRGSQGGVLAALRRHSTLHRSSTSVNQRAWPNLQSVLGLVRQQGDGGGPAEGAMPLGGSAPPLLEAQQQQQLQQLAQEELPAAAQRPAVPATPARPGSAGALARSNSGAALSPFRAAADTAAAANLQRPGLALVTAPMALSRLGSPAVALAPPPAAATPTAAAVPPPVAGMPLPAVASFPATDEGRVAQLRWFSFQLLVEELAEELGDLQAGLARVLAGLP